MPQRPRVKRIRRTGATLLARPELRYTNRDVVPALRRPFFSGGVPLMRRTLLAAAVLVLAAGPASAKLELKDIKAVYGDLGPERKSLEYYAYDEVLFRFRVTGAKADKDGK